MTAHIRRLSVMVLLLALAGCGGAFRQPQVTLENVQLAGLGRRAGTLLVKLEMVNPNRFALNATALEYQVAIADTGEPGDPAWLDPASGVYDEPFSIGPGATELVQ